MWSRLMGNKQEGAGTAGLRPSGASSDEELGGKGSRKASKKDKRAEDSDDEDLGGKGAARRGSSGGRRSSLRKSSEAGASSGGEDADLGGSRPRRGSSSSRGGSKSGQDDSGRPEEAGGKKSSSKKKSGEGHNASERKLLRQAATREKEEEEQRQKEQASKKLVTTKELDLAVDKDDLEGGSRALRLTPAELSDFVSVPVFPDDGPVGVADASALSGAAANGPVFERQGELDNNRGRVLVPTRGSARFGAVSRGASRWNEEVFLENGSSGRFTRMLYELDASGKRVDDGSGPGEEELGEYTPERLRAAMDHVEYVLEGFFMVCQGLLAGGSLFQLIVVLQLQDARTFLAIYGPLAGEVRRMFYFLSTLAFVGVLDKIQAERDQQQSWKSRGAKERAEMVVYALLFFLVLLFTLLTFKQVDQIDYHFAVLAADAMGPAQEEDAATTIRRWRTFVALRFGFAAVGWVMVCQDANRDLLRGRKRYKKIEQCEKDIAASQEQVARLSGKSLETASMSDLERLTKTLATGLAEVQLQLSIRAKAL
jgi:hypothetical protein